MQKKNNILIVGCGNIGQMLYKEYQKLEPDRYDPYKNINEKKNIKYDIAFIAVDTPRLEDGTCDLSQVKQAIQETNAEICVIRSTVPVGTTERMIEETNRRIIFAPEFYGVTQHTDPNTFDFKYTILGGNKKDCGEVTQALQACYDARYRFLITDSKTAELSKYMVNTLMASKVSLCVQFWKIANQFGIEYNELRELVLQDSRINRAHTFVYANQPYWDSHCFNKDLIALTKFAEAPLIEQVIKFNEDCKEETK